MTRGGGGVSKNVILHEEGGGGVQTPPKKDDIIYEQPLIHLKYFKQTRVAKPGAALQTRSQFIH